MLQQLPALLQAIMWLALVGLFVLLSQAIIRKVSPS